MLFINLCLCNSIGGKYRVPNYTKYIHFLQLLCMIVVPIIFDIYCRRYDS